jgi:hypothetical protein
MRYKILAYRTRFTYPAGARGDVLYEDLLNGEIDIRENICLCGWCAKSCQFQREITFQVYKNPKTKKWVGCGRDFLHLYLRGTRGKWVIVDDDEERVKTILKLFELANKNKGGDV